MKCGKADCGMRYAVRQSGKAVGYCSLSIRCGTRDEDGFHPGTAHFDLAAAAGMDHFGTDRIRLENVVLREALMLDEGERTVQVLVSPTENGADFEIFSRGAGQGQGEWHQHVSGQLAPGAVVVYERAAEAGGLESAALRLVRTREHGISAVDLLVAGAGRDSQ